MKPYTLSFIFVCSILFTGCSSQQFYTDKSPELEINGGEIVTPDTHIELQVLINMLTADVGEYVFEPIVVTGKTDWDFLSEEWQYQENHHIYLRKLTLDIKTTTFLFGGSRVITVHLNRDTLYRDKNSLEYMDFRGDATIRLTRHIGIATFKGDIIDVPTK
ncbi:MAG: hypothetical protein OXN27_11875 [Candidatus Poribacteria bacterium]|nr:hypothetical protein [Candidatus Poribacteria bacterium]